MKASPYISILIMILCLSGVSAFLLYSYLDPERNLPVAFVTMGIAAVLFSTSLSSLILYFIKKIYYRGIITPSILHASIRQGLFLALGGLCLLIFFKLGILNYKTGGLLLFIFFLFELMIQSIVED